MKTSALALVLLLSLTIAGQDKDKFGKILIDDDQSYLVLSTKKIQTMEKELDDVSSRGFRVVYGAPTQQYDMAILLERVKNPAPKPFAYRILATSRRKTMEKELNDLAIQGYRLLPRTIVFKQGFLTAEMVMVMEKDPNDNKNYEYRLISASKETKLHKKIDESISQGYLPVTMITIGEHTVVAEKETEAAKLASR